ncbi:Small RNA 2'-O-methyltransferase [Balamuthia mandrillaris]
MEVQEAGKFFPPLHVQRHQCVQSILARLHVRGKVCDFGCGEGELLKRLRREESFAELWGIDWDDNALAIATENIKPHLSDWLSRRSTSLKISLLQGSICDPLPYHSNVLQPCDALTLVEVIEHIEPVALNGLERNIFEVLRPRVVVVTTPNRDFNQLFSSSSNHPFRHWDHKFEWNRAEFASWCSSIANRFDYSFSYSGVGTASQWLGQQNKKELEDKYGCCTQIATFVRGSTILKCLQVKETQGGYGGAEGAFKVIASVEYPTNARTRQQQIIDEFMYSCWRLHSWRMESEEESLGQGYEWLPIKDVFDSSRALTVGDICCSLEYLVALLQAQQATAWRLSEDCTQVALIEKEEEEEQEEEQEEQEQ